MVEEGSSGLAFLSLFTWIWRTEIMKVALDNQKLQYSGRIDDSDPKRPQFIFPATSLGFRFFGRTATLKVQNKRVYWKNYVGAIVDGEQKTFELKDEGMTELLLVDGEERDHEVLFFKRMDSCHELILEELTLSEGSQLLEMPQKPKRKIEVYGDSVSAGEVSEAEEYRGQVDPEHNGEYSNSWYSYGWITARKLNAQIHDIAQGGIALLDGTGWFCDPEFLGMESVWDKVHYNPEISPMTTWDFSRYTPDVVIVAIGQNDTQKLVDVILTLGEHDNRIDYALFYDNIETFMKHYVTMDLTDINLGDVVQEIFMIAHKHRISMPKGVSMLARGLVTIESTVMLVDPHISIIEIAANHVASHMSKEFDAKKELTNSAKKVYDASQNILNLPVQLSEVIRMIMKGRLKVNLDIMESSVPMKAINHMVNKLIVGIISAGLLMASSLLCTTQMTPKVFGIPALGFIGFMTAVGLGIWLLFTVLKERRKNK